MTRTDEPPADLAALAAAHRVATSYRDADDVEQTPPAATLRAVLHALDVPCATPQEVTASLATARRRAEERVVAPTVVLREGGQRHISLRVPPGMTLQARLRLEDGTEVVPTSEHGELCVPIDVGLGAHLLVLEGLEEPVTAHVLVVPDRCPVPQDLCTWGWQVQLYALRSRASWGIGDLGDLQTLVEAAGRRHGADFVLLNPLHAVMPVLPQQPSPYYPSSRRAWNPLYLRVEECDGWQALVAADPTTAAAWQAEGRRLTERLLIERDAVFAVKDRALRRAAALPLAPERQVAFADYRAAGGPALADVATAFALATRYGGEVSRWPAGLRRPDGVAVTEARVELADEIAYQVWLQWQCDEQLSAAAAVGVDAGLRLGLVTDLAVGVDADGADGWSLTADLAEGMTVGAPPDALAQRGQDWRLPPLRPDRLAATGYAAFRELVRATLRHAGGLRIDHVMGLFRLYWIPEGASATEGTYVSYDADAMLGALALETQRAGAVVVGEDLGTVEEGVRETLATRGVLGSAVFWFERPEAPVDARNADDDDAPRPAHSRQYRRLALTSVTTHDLPTVAGWAAGEPSRLRAALDQLATDPATDRRQSVAQRDALLDLLAEEGLLAASERTDVAALVRAVHTFVARTPSVLVTAGLADAVGDLRQPNLPGTIDEYPNWRLPVAEPAAEPAAGRAAEPPAESDGIAGVLPPSRAVLLDDLVTDVRVDDLARVLRSGRARSPSSVNSCGPTC